MPSEAKPADTITEKHLSIFEIRSERRRLIILIILALAGLLLPFTDSVYFPALAHIEHDLHASTVLVDYTISTYLIAAGIAGLFWGPLGDRYGRKYILLITFTLFLGFSIVCGFARSITVLLIFRSLQGASISASLVVGQSVIVDMYPPHRLGFALGLFLVPLLVGPIIGPFIGGALTHRFGWRSTFFSLAIGAFIAMIAILFFVPETHHYFVLKRTLHNTKKKSKTKQKVKIVIQEADHITKPQFMPPWHPFLVLTDMTITPHIAACNINFTALFVSLTLMSNREAQEPYMLPPLYIGFTYIPLGIFSLIGSITGGWISDWSAERFPHVKEGRLIISSIGSLLCPVGLLICGWTYHFGIHLAVPIIASTLFAFAEAFLYTSVCAFANIKRPAMAGSLLALINSLSFCCAGIGIIVSAPLLTLIKFGSVFSVLAGIAFCLTSISLCIVIYQMRRSTRPAPCGNVARNGSLSNKHSTTTSNFKLIERF